MSRTLSVHARQAIADQETDEIFVLLLEIENYDDSTQPIRLALNTENVDSTCGDVFSSAQTFAGGIFEIELPEETGESSRPVRISIDNVDRRIVEAARGALEPPRVRMWIVTNTSPNTVEAGPFRFVLESVTYDSAYVRGDLVFEEVTQRRWPKHDFTPNNTPGIF